MSVAETLGLARLKRWVSKINVRDAKQINHKASDTSPRTSLEDFSVEKSGIPSQIPLASQSGVMRFVQLTPSLMAANKFKMDLPHT